VHLVGFIVRIRHNAQSHECKILTNVLMNVYQPAVLPFLYHSEEIFKWYCQVVFPLKTQLYRVLCSVMVVNRKRKSGQKL
jgi:hypothetical protein